MRSSIRPTACALAVLISLAACSDATAPVPSLTSGADQSPNFARGGGGFNPTLPQLPPLKFDLPGGAHFTLGFSPFFGYMYFPANAAAFAIAPHGLDLNHNPLP